MWRLAKLSSMGWDIPLLKCSKRLLTLVPDGPGIYTEWKRTVKDHKILGVKVYDARLAQVRHQTGKN